jgi:hypothetical protein
MWKCKIEGIVDARQLQSQKEDIKRGDCLKKGRANFDLPQV